MLDRLNEFAHKSLARIETGLPSRRLKVGSSDFFLPSAFPNIAKWKPNWKCQLIRRLIGSHAKPVFLDIGANLGQTLVDYLAADVGGNYFGFEPNPTCVMHLQRFIDLNKIPNAFVFPLCLSDTTEVVRFYKKNDTDDSATIVSDLRPGEIQSQSFVPAFTLDNVVGQQNWCNVDLIKIDVEGAELSVLEGMTRVLEDLRPMIICEVLRADGNANLDSYKTTKSRLVQTLNQHRYSIFNVIKSASDGFVRLEKCDTFPIEIWTQNNANQCDYLFVPEEADLDLNS